MPNAVVMTGYGPPEVLKWAGVPLGRLRLRAHQSMPIDGSGLYRHGLGEERGPRQRHPAHPAELDADQLPPMVRRGAQARDRLPGTDRPALTQGPAHATKQDL
jgi:hypothetical protein